LLVGVLEVLLVLEVEQEDIELMFQGKLLGQIVALNQH